MRYYLCGPMTGLPDSNYPAFDAAAARLRGLGFDVDNPAERSREHPGRARWQYLRWDIPALCVCDRVAVLPGWRKSYGATREILVALACKIPVVWAHDLTPVPLDCLVEVGDYPLE